ncbi:iron-containing redox enzyme family protein [Rhodospirillum sp. A1_3_36]|uniref:iron-containing redox enzyme family protein n=1 Tax=Rhodospirillum sp. A1_3_36 TaxID=3391666 RepID=UPI0039A62EEC
MMHSDPTTLQSNEVADVAVDGVGGREYNKVAEAIVSHPAIQELDKFGSLLKDNPLDLDSRAAFLATCWPFFKTVAAGILILSARITDELLETDPWDAQPQGAFILFASVDEYGLHQTNKFNQPHHILFKELSEHLGVSTYHLASSDFVEHAGKAMGELSNRYYRDVSIGQSLGFHLASEMVSSREFLYFLEGFQNHAEYYGLKDKNDPVLSFFKVHSIVEPMHAETGKKSLLYFLNRDPEMAGDVMEGALAFMDGFDNMFKSINSRVFAPHA